MRAIDCQGFAGAFTYGVRQAGFELRHKVELPGGFGVGSVEPNRALLGDFDIQVGPATTWELFDDVDLLFGNPPCSGFSGINTAGKGGQAPGPDSSINSCMWDLVRYGSRLGATWMTLESVQGAYKRGRGLMQALRDEANRLTGQRYVLTHVLVSGAALGAAQIRKRYFMVLGPAPLRVMVPPRRTPVTYHEALSDLMGLQNTWEAQSYKVSWREIGAWAFNKRRTGTGENWQVDSHAWADDHDSVHVQRVQRLLALRGELRWQWGEKMQDVVRRYYEATGTVPFGFDLQKLLDRDFEMRFQQPKRVTPDKPGYVVTGTGGLDFVHWSEDRLLSVRECARLQGFPDAWSFREATSIRQALAWIGKGIPVESGNWLARMIAGELAGSDWGVHGARLDRGEYLVDVTHAHLGRVTVEGTDL